MDGLPEIERETRVSATPQAVWVRIIEGELAEEWMGVRIDPRPGGRVTVEGRQVIGAVEEIVPGESITWSWRDIDGDPSQVTITVTPDGCGTRVRVTERLLEYRITGSPPVFLACAA